MKQTMEEINNHLKKDLFFIPPYPSISCKEVVNELYKVFRNENNKDFQLQRNKEGKTFKLLNEITTLIYNPSSRAIQFNNYKKLTIFTPFILKNINYATISYFEGNEFAYLNLVPVVEALFYNWHNESKPLNTFSKAKRSAKGKDKGIRQYLTDKLNSITFDSSSEYDQTILIPNKNFLLQILIIFYDSNNSKNYKYFNRNILLHHLEEISYGDLLLNTLRLFLIIDIIAMLYQYEQHNTTNLFYEYRKEDDVLCALYLRSNEKGSASSSFNLVKKLFDERNIACKVNAENYLENYLKVFRNMYRT